MINWYRSPSVIHDNFEQLYTEMSSFFHDATGVIMIGDLNIHHKKWLRFSNADTTMGTELKTFCDFHGFFQIVRAPTRKEYLLDLAITDIPKATASVLPCIADHSAILVKLPLPEVLEKSFTRTVWNLRKPEWKKLEQELDAFNWAALRNGTAEGSLLYFLEVLWNALVKYIPRKDIVSRKSTYPWLSDQCRKALVQKNNAQGTDRFEAECFNCVKILGEERAAYIQKIKEKLQNLRRHSK